MHERLTTGILVDAHLEGDDQVLTFAQGVVVRELIVDVDDEQRLLAYAVVEGSKKQTLESLKPRI